MRDASPWPTAKDGGFIVGVSAFGLYAETHDFNASNLVLAALPSNLDSRTSGEPKIHILKYPEIHVTYDAVSRATHDIWSEDSATWAGIAAAAGIDYADGNTLKVSFVVHLGQMRAYPGYSFEKLASRDHYERRDLDGMVPTTVEQDDGSLVEDRFAYCPAVLEPDVDVEEVTAIVKETVPVSFSSRFVREELVTLMVFQNTLLRASTEAGRFSCEYLLYSSLAALHKKGLQKRVLFTHVPSKDSEEEIAKGVEVVTALIRTISKLFP
ncbi:MAG: hypothetical protein Q9207_003148 [Kuettlingeria erythrocarpa]